MQEDKQKWNSRFSQRDDTFPLVPEFIQEVATRLVPGSVLDFASGDGAAALHLAEQGFAVTAADISDVALARLKRFSQQRDSNIATLEIDADNTDALDKLGLFNNIVMARFKPSETLLQKLALRLVPGGKLVLTTFNLAQHQAHGFPKRFCLAPNEMHTVSDLLSVEHYASVNRNDSHMDDYLFVRC